MKQLKPRTIMLIGVPALFLAFAGPFAFYADSKEDLYTAVIGGVLFTTLVGLPLFGTMALAARCSHSEPDADPITLDRRLRYIERCFACAGMLSIGYMIGWFVNCPLVHLEETRSTIQFIVSLVLLLVSMLVMMVVAVAKIGLVKRLEVLKARIETAKNAKNESVSAT